MGILDGIVDWLATQVMNLLDLASTSVLGALDCNMDTFKRYFPAASAMYEIFIWTAIGLVLLNLVWQLYRCYGAGFDIDTEMLCWGFWFSPRHLPLPWARLAAQTIFSKAGAGCSADSFCC